MGEGGGNADPVPGGGKRFGNIAKDHVVVVGDAVRMGGDAAVEHENLAVGEQFAQVIECAPVAEPEFQDRAGDVGNKVRSQVQAVTLRGHPADE